MAVLQMEHIQLCAMNRDRKAVLELLQRRGVVEVRETDAGDDGVFENPDTSASRAVFIKHAETAAQAAETVDRYEKQDKPALAFLQGRKAVSPGENDAFAERRDAVLRMAQAVVQCEREIAEDKAAILRSEAQEDALVAWLDLPVPQTFTGTKKTAVFIGSVEGERSREDLLATLAEAQPDLARVDVEIVSKSPEQTNFYVLVLKSDAALAEEALRQMGFMRPGSATHHLPRDKQKRLQQERKDAEGRIEAASQKIKEMAPSYEDFHQLEDHMRTRAEKYDVIERLAQSKHTFVLNGWVPQKMTAALTEELDRKFDLAVSTYEAEASNEVPVLLENNWFARPTEGVLASYSMPGVGEIDPISIMAPFYYIMFGLMFSDAGYGLLMAGVCAFCLWKFKNMEPNWQKNLQLFFWCGVSTIFWGIVFSSYFGDIVNVVSATFFGREVGIPPLWFSPLEEPMSLLMFCMAIGIVHLTVGYVLKGVTCWKNGQKVDVIYETVFPIGFIYPVVLVLLSTEMIEGMAGFRIPLPPMVTTVCLAIAGVCCVGVVLFGGRESKNWGKRLLKGLYATYNMVAGWLSDILSYSRLLALGLATGVIASVMNQLGAMAGGGIVGAILFIIVFAIGQALNFGINVLGSYVHSNRLEYVEFFGKFYDGGGRKFEPLGIHTKYYKIQEETTNGSE